LVFKEHTEREFRRDLQHHAITVPGIERTSGFFHRPPAGTHAIAQTDVACTRRGGWIFFRKRLSMSLVFPGHRNDSYGLQMLSKKISRKVSSELILYL
jgi:hypothetical protein